MTKKIKEGENNGGSRWISTGRLLRQRDQIGASVTDSARTAGDLLKPFGVDVPVPTVQDGIITQFADFLNKKVFEAVGISSAVHQIATAKEPNQRAKLREQLVGFLQGKEAGLGALIPLTAENKMSPAATLSEDPHFRENYLPVLVVLNELGAKTVKQIDEAEAARKKSLGNQNRITTAFLRGAEQARSANRTAEKKRTVLDDVSERLARAVISHVDIVTDTSIDGLIKKANSASKDESDARIKEAKARTVAGVALSSFLPALSATETTTTGEVGLHLIDQMVNTAFLFTIACYEGDVALGIKLAGQDTVLAFSDFMQSAAERRTRLTAQVNEMRQVIKEIPTETKGGQSV